MEDTADEHAMSMALNRTMVELKLAFILYSRKGGLSLNRTMVELKLEKIEGTFRGLTRLIAQWLNGNPPSPDP